jgi:hypothetical protein
LEVGSTHFFVGSKVCALRLGRTYQG